ncbi:hypothetical protein O181_111257 [Austropuccinia psidii MF-1]|uniref:Uncharacterized protein n=1 Tax=Austropuccinia psidii MF-1 TaxID=1389203 RepID=A0A9Q3JZK9_9BASI|nr:hypothetical protein [Austropuccinia psidii MF-1]
MEPEFQEGCQVLVSTLKFNNLKGPKKMRDLFVEPFTTIKLVRKKAVEFKLTEEFSMKHPVFPVSLVKPYFQKEVEDSAGPVEKFIRARKIRLNGRDQRQY